MKTIYIGVGGTEVESGAEAVASRVVSSRAESFFVRTTAEGRLFNPNDATARLTERDKDRGGPKYVLRQCNKDTYQRYVEFLTTRNRANLLVAERGFINDRK